MTLPFAQGWEGSWKWLGIPTRFNDSFTSLLRPCPFDAKPLGRVVGAGTRRHSRRPRLAVADRVCLDCPAVLSRYNDDVRCAQCRAARIADPMDDTYPPLPAAAFERLQEAS